MIKDKFQNAPGDVAEGRILRRCLSIYLSQNKKIWNRLPIAWRRLPLCQAYGRHLHALVCRHSDRRQSFGTFFLRNRAELELMNCLLRQRTRDTNLKLCVLACSKGAELYSILWAIRSVRPELKITTHAVDISQEILDFAKRGVYSLKEADVTTTPVYPAAQRADVSWNTVRDQNASIYERMTEAEKSAMFEVEGDRATVRPWLKEGINWLCGDAADPELVSALGLQDMVVANRFLCHMKPADAERCLRKVAQLVKPGGYLFVSGVDLDVRTRVAQEMRWKPVTTLLREVHDGDTSLSKGWPMEYWGLEPFRGNRPERRTRYVCVFQLGEEIDSAASLACQGEPTELGFSR